MNTLHKHATSSVFLFHGDPGARRIGLIHHPRLHRWMLPGGHTESHENTAGTALREVLEETGRTAQLIGAHPDVPGYPGTARGVDLPAWIVEQDVPADSRHPKPHIHIDHLFIAITTELDAAGPVELPFQWVTREELDPLHMFPDSRTLAHLLFDQIDRLAPQLGTPTRITTGA